MRRHIIGILLVTTLVACSSTPPPLAWEANAHSASTTAVQHYLTGNARAEEQDYARAYKELTATGRADLLAQLELTRCAAKVASLVFEECTAFLPLAADASPAQRAYAAFLMGRWEGLNGSLLPKHHANLLINASVSSAQAAALLQIADPLSRLVAAGSLVRRGALSPETFANVNGSSNVLASVTAIAVDTASAQAWRRPLLAWLGLQLKQAEIANNTVDVERLRRRIALVYSSPVYSSPATAASNPTTAKP